MKVNKSLHCLSAFRPCRTTLVAVKNQDGIVASPLPFGIPAVPDEILQDIRMKYIPSESPLPFGIPAVPDQASVGGNHNEVAVSIAFRHSGRAGQTLVGLEVNNDTLSPLPFGIPAVPDGPDADGVYTVRFGPVSIAFRHSGRAGLQTLVATSDGTDVCLHCLSAFRPCRTVWLWV